jgi:hypothetical protein
MAEVTSRHEPNVPNVMGNTPILMNRLRHLCISDSEALCQLLPTIQTPLLKTLILRNREIELGLDSFTDTQLNAYYFPPLTSLSLLDIICDSGDSLLYFALMTSAARKFTIVHQSDAIAGVLHGIRRVLATCLIEGVPETELRIVVHWPPGGSGVVSHRRRQPSQCREVPGRFTF